MSATQMRKMGDVVETVTMEPEMRWGYYTNENGEQEYDCREVGKKPVKRKQRFIIVQWEEVRQKVMRVTTYGDPWPSQRTPYSELQELKGDGALGSWAGSYVNDEGKKVNALKMDARSWVSNGFYSAAFETLAQRNPIGMQHRATWNDEEGDIDLSRLYGGWDDYMLGPVRQPSKPGIRVQFEFCFACGVPNSTIAEYGVFVMKFLAGMEQAGFDIAVDAWICLDGLFIGDEQKSGYYMTQDGRRAKRRTGRYQPIVPAVRSNVLLRVKNPGEVSDPSAWSVLFSPIGFRKCGFAALGVAGDKIGQTTVPSLGNTISGRDWDLVYSKDTGVVTISCNQRAGYGHGEAKPWGKLMREAIKLGLLPKNEDEE